MIPETTLGALAADVKRRSGSSALRVVGDPKARVSRIRLGVGYASPPINAPDIDVLISGEQQESDGTFDSQPYALDAVTLGIAKGIILLGHTISEEAGMLEMAQWIKGFVPEIPVQLVKAEEPLWGPTYARAPPIPREHGARPAAARLGRLDRSRHRDRGRERSADLVIVGGELGGCAAALAAAAPACRVILTEATDWIGGQLTSQAVPPDEHPWIEQFGCTRAYRAVPRRRPRLLPRPLPAHRRARAPTR